MFSFKMDVKVYFLEIIVILVLFQGKRVETALDVTSTTFNATGVENGLAIQLEVSGSPDVKCLIDGGDGYVEIFEVPDPSMTLETSLNSSGYFDLNLLIFGELRFEVYRKEHFYVGEYITGVEYSNNDTGYVIPFKSPLTADVVVEFGFLTGTDVDIAMELELPDTTWTDQINNATNGTHNFVIPRAKFETSGLFTVVLTLTNPLHETGILQYIMLAIQEPVTVGSVYLKQYPSDDDPIHVMVNQEFEVEFQLTGGDDLTFSLTVEQGDTTVEITGNSCTGKIAVNSIAYTFTSTGAYNLSVEISNYVSSYNNTVVTEVIHPVNVTVEITPSVLLSSGTVSFKATVESTALLPMGIVTCVVDFDDDESDGSIDFDLSPSEYSSLTKTTDTLTKSYEERWYATIVNCSNQLPSEINSLQTYNSYEQMVKVVNDINSLQVTSDSPVPSHHPSSLPITFTVSQTNPSTDPPNANLTCEFSLDSGDNVELVIAEGDATSSSSITYVKQFNGGKDYTVSVNCSNLLDSQSLELSDTFTVYFDCWNPEHYFHSSYKTESGAMTSKTNENMQINSDVVLTGNCAGLIQHFWTLYSVNANTDTFIKNLTSSSTTLLNLEAFEIENAGLYKLELSVFFIGYEITPLLSDFVYLQYALPELLISVTVDDTENDMKTVFNALSVHFDSSQSSDPNDLARATDSLTRSWECFTGSALSRDDVLEYISSNDLDNLPDTAPDSCLELLTQGAVEFTIPQDTLVSGRWYIFKLSVDDSPTSRASKKVQALNAIAQQPLDVTLQNITNGYETPTNIYVLAMFDLQLNIRLNTPGILNSSVDYRWSFSMKNSGETEYTDKSSYIDPSTSKTGFKIAKQTFEDLDGHMYLVSCAVSAPNFADAIVTRIFKMNLPPYSGECHWKNLPADVKASITDVCFTCSGWLNEVDGNERSATDKGVSLKYVGVQIFLDETGDVDPTNPAREHPSSVNPEQCFKLLKSTNEKVNKTRVQVKILDHLQSPHATVTLGDIELEPAVQNDASGTDGAAQVESLVNSSLAALESAKQTNSLDGTAGVVAVVFNALPSKVPVAEPIQPASDDPDDGGLFPTENKDGSPISPSELFSSFNKQEEDPTLTKCKEVVHDLATTLLDTTKAQSSETKQNPASQSTVLSAVSDMAIASTLLDGKSLDLMEEVVADIFVHTAGVETGSPEADDFIEQMLYTTNNVASAMEPKDRSELVADVSLEAIRQQKMEAYVFASEERKNQDEAADLGSDVQYFFSARLALINKKDADERQARCIKFSKKKAEFQKNITHNAKISDGSVKKIETNGAEAAVTRDTSTNIANKTLSTKNSNVKMPNVGHNGLEKITLALFAQKSVSHIDSNAEAATITSGETTLIAETEGALSGTVKITQKTETVTMQKAEIVNDPDDASGFSLYLQTYVKKQSDDLYLNFASDPDSVLNIVKCKVYILHIANVAEIDDLFVSKVSKTAVTECTATGKGFVAKFSPEDRKGTKGVFKVGVETETEGGNNTDPSRRKRAAVLNKNETFQYATATMACMTWDDSTNSWRSDECVGTWKPDEGELECDCKPKKEMTFANSFYVAPNKIDFSSVFLKFSPLNQAAVMATLGLIFIIYILIIIWARRQDRKDLLKWGITPLSDNFSEDNYFYVIKVFTGMRPGAGTRSRISMVISGEEMDTGVRELSDGVREEFSTGSVMNFLMSTTVYLGDLDYIRIWHDNSGGGSYASWYLSRMEVHDVQRNESFSFLGERWLAVEKEDGLIECVLPVSKAENLNVFKNRFFLNAKDNLADSHIWISVAYRPQASSFTRAQRASCALLFVMLTMIANAMFFKGSNEDNFETPAELQVGPFRFSLQQIYISFVCALIVTPGTLIVIYLFKLAKVKVDPNVTLFKPSDKPSRYKIPFMNNWLENEQKRSQELEQHLVQKGLPNNQGLSLPHWCRYLAWFIVVVTSLICAFFIMLYSMDWGKQKSEEWITTFLLSFFESVFCLDPVKVGIMALVLAILFRSTKDSQAPVNRSTIMKRYSSSLRAKSRGLRLPAPPLDQKKLEKAREEKQRDMLMKRALRDIIVNIIIIWILFSISFSNRDTRSYYMHWKVVNTFLEPRNQPSFNKIKTTTDFFKWLNETAIINAFPEYEKDANNTPLHWRVRQFTEGGTNFRVGPPRLRQLRTTKESCTNAPFPREDCFKRYSEPSEETGPYCIGWNDGPCDPDDLIYKYSSEAWKFTSAFDIWGMPISGYYATYGGGGYIAKLSVNRQVSQVILDELYENSWVDRQTRAVLFEFTIYCLNANIFTYNMFMVEFPETGGAMPYHIIFPMRIYLHQGPLGLYTLACEVLFVLYLIILTIMTIVQIVRQKKAFFKQGWQVYDLIFIILAYVAIIMNIIQVVFTDMSLDTFREDKKAFVNFYHLAIWNMILVLLIGLLVFMATIRLLNILGYNKRIGAVAKVFTKAASDLLWFGIFFSYVFTCYAAFGYLLFGWKLKSYKNVFTTMGTLFISMIGKSRFTEIEETDPVFSKIYFMCFIFFVVYMILTMFLAVLSKAIDQVHEDTKRDKSEEMVDYVIKKMKGLMSYGSTAKKGAVKPAPWNRDPSNWSRKHRAGLFNKTSNREILQEIRETMNEALTVDPRDFKTPEVEHGKRKVKLRH